MDLKQFRSTLYFVSPEGIVISRYSYGGHKGNSKNRERVVGQGKSRGYPCVRNRHKGYRWYVHQMVMEVWGAPCPAEGYVIDHIDEDKTNNNISNLQWLKRGENVCKTLSQTKPKLTKKQADEIRATYKPRKITRKQLAEAYGVSEATIKDVIAHRYY
jgi:hypothetical protein